MSERKTETIFNGNAATPAEKLRELLNGSSCTGIQRQQGLNLLREHVALEAANDHFRRHRSMNHNLLHNTATQVTCRKSHGNQIDEAAEALLTAIANVAGETDRIMGETKRNICDKIECLLKAYEHEMEQLIAEVEA